MPLILCSMKAGNIVNTIIRRYMLLVVLDVVRVYTSRARDVLLYCVQESLLLGVSYVP